MQDGDTRHCSFTQASLRALQQIHNKLLRLLLGHGYETPTLQLLEESNMLSVNQLIAYSVITTLFKIKQSKEPLYLANRLGFINNSNTRGRSCDRQHDINIDFRLATSREGFMYQAGKCWNSLPLDLKLEIRGKVFKTRLHEWIKLNIVPIPH